MRIWQFPAYPLCPHLLKRPHQGTACTLVFLPCLRSSVFLSTHFLLLLIRESSLSLSLEWPSHSISPLTPHVGSMRTSPFLSFRERITIGSHGRHHQGHLGPRGLVVADGREQQVVLGNKGATPGGWRKRCGQAPHPYSRASA